MILIVGTVSKCIEFSITFLDIFRETHFYLGNLSQSFHYDAVNGFVYENSEIPRIRLFQFYVHYFLRSNWVILKIQII